MLVLAHYTRKLGRNSGDWNTYEGAVYHADAGGYTLCGLRSDAPGLRSGTSDRGWEKRELPKNRLDCKRCLRKRERERSS
jgi:hypothetical protein